MRLLLGVISNIFSSKKILSISMAVLMGIGLILRLHRLGYYPILSTDEAITALSVKGILQHGYSVFPSGVLYFKELLFTYPTSWLCKTFGLNEFALRVFNLPFSVGLILLIYLMGKKLFSAKEAILSAAIMTFATWELEFSRYSRSYILFQFLLILSVYIFFKAFVKEERINKILLFLLFVLTVFSSMQGVVLMVIFLSLWLIKGRELFKSVTVAFILLFSGFIIIWSQLFSILVGPIQLQGYTAESFSIINIIKRINIPKFYILSHFIINHSLSWYFILLIYLLISFYILRRMLINKGMIAKGPCLLFLCVSALALFNLPELGILIFCGYAIVTKSKIDIFKNGFVIASLTALIIFTLGWFCYGLFFWKGASLTGIKNLYIIKDVLKHLNLFNFPSLVYFSYFIIPFPKMSFIVVLGLCLLYLRSFKGGLRDNAAFLGTFFIGSLLLFALAWKHSAPRYNFAIYPFFILIYSFAIIQISSWVSSLIPSPKLPKNLLRVSVLFFILLFSLEHANPVEAYKAVNVNYGQPVIEPYIFTSHRLTHYFDERSAAEFVKAHMNKDDIVIAQERLVQYYYIGKLDYYLYFLYGDEFSVTGAEVIEKKTADSDIYIRCGAIFSLGGLKEVLDKNIKQNRTVWLIIHNYSRLKYPQRTFTQELRDGYSNLYAFLKIHPDSLKFVAKDNLTEVYRFSLGTLIKG